MMSGELTDSPFLTPYRKRTLEYTLLYVAGFPTHNKEDNECCPDFSCCRPEMFETDVNKRRDAYFRLLKMYGIKQ